MSPVSPAAAAASQAAAQAWAAAMAQRKGQCRMQPADEATYFQAPRIGTFTLPYNTPPPVPVSISDPMRTSITFAVIFQGWNVTATNTYTPTVTIGPTPTFIGAVNAIPGFALSPFNPTLTLSVDTFPGLIQGIWYAFNSQVIGQVLPTVFLTVTEILLRTWPKGKG